MEKIALLTVRVNEQAPMEKKMKHRILVPRQAVSSRSIAISRTLLAASIGFALAVPAAAQESADRVEELIVNATRLPRTIENIAGTVTLVTAEQIEREMTEDLDDLVRFQPGVSISTARRGGNEGFSIRGIGGNRVLTVIDGIRSNDIFEAGPATYGRDSIDTDNIKTAELIRGPASVLYGADAIGGAIILTSKDPRDYLEADRNTFFGLRASTADADAQNRGGFTAAVQNGDLGLLAQYTHRQFGEQEVNGPGSLNPQDGTSDSLLLQLNWDLAPGQLLRFSVDNFVEEIATQLDSDIGRSVSGSHGLDDTERLRFGIQYQWQAGLALFDDLEASVNQMDTDATQFTEQQRTSYSFIDPRNPSTYGGTSAQRKTTFEFNQQTLALNLNLRKTIEVGSVTHAIAYGANIEETDTQRPRNRCEEDLASGQTSCRISAFPFAPPEVFPNKTIPDTSTARFGFYLQDEMVFGDGRFTLIPGARYDRYQMDAMPDPTLDGTGQVSGYGFPVESIDEGAASLSLGALYDFDEIWSMFGQYAEGYRPPNFAEANQSFVNLGFQYATVPNPELAAENSKGLELGVRASFANAFLSVAAYRNRYTNFIESAFVGTEGAISLFQNRNIGKVEIRGAEFNAQFILNEHWQARTALAYARGDNETASTPLDSVDPLTAVAGLRYDAPSTRWGGELLLTAVGAKDRVSATDRVTAEAYNVVDLIGYFNVTDAARLRFGLFNVTDELYARWINISSLNTDSISAIENAHQPGTNFRVGLHIDI